MLHGEQLNYLTNFIMREDGLMTVGLMTGTGVYWKEVCSPKESLASPKSITRPYAHLGLKPSHHPQELPFLKQLVYLLSYFFCLAPKTYNESSRSGPSEVRKSWRFQNCTTKTPILFIQKIPSCKWFLLWLQTITFINMFVIQKINKPKPCIKLWQNRAMHFLCFLKCLKHFITLSYT